MSDLLRDHVVGLGELRGELTAIRPSAQGDGDPGLPCVVRRFPVPGLEEQAQTLLKKLVIAWDSHQDLEFDDALRDARVLLGFKLRRKAAQA